MNLSALTEKYSFYLISAVYLALLFFFVNTPVFWDMYGQIKTASYFLDTGFKDLLPNGSSYSDNGHFPFYPLYLAALFKVFGYNLWVAHLSVLPFLLGSLFQLQKFARRFLNAQQTFWTLMLTLFHPAFLTQTFYFSQEIAIVFFSLWLINALFDERSSHIAMASVLLCLFNLRGISLCGVLLIYFLWVRKGKHAWYLLCGFFLWIIWVIVHYLKTGWFFSGEEIKEFRSVAPPERMLKNFLIALWKMIDLGSVFAWAAILVICIRVKKIFPSVTILAFASLSVILLCVPFSNPISNRYFLLSYVLLLPAFMQCVVALDKKLPIAITACFVIVLFSNNGVMYPNRYGNAWDCSLKSFPYFKLRKDLDTYLAQQNISPQSVEAGFQVYFNDRFYLMNGVDREYSLLSDTEMPSKEYVVDSDICNNFNEQREKFLAEHYTPVKEFRRGAVYLRLYQKKLGFRRDFFIAPS